MNNRGEQVIGELRRRITALIADFGITYDEYQIAQQWLVEVGEAGEWPLVLALFEHTVEQQAHKDRAGSQGTILGPFYLPGAPVLQAPYELPRRPDEKGERLLITGRVLSADGTPLPGAVLDVWQADADGLYSGFSQIPAGILRGKVITGTEGRFELRTIAPGAVHGPARRSVRPTPRSLRLAPVAPGPHPPDRLGQPARTAHHPAVSRLKRLPRQRRRRCGQGPADRAPAAPRRPACLRLRVPPGAGARGGTGRLKIIAEIPSPRRCAAKGASSRPPAASHGSV